MKDCKHPIFLQRVTGVQVVCCYCDQVSADLMEVQRIHRGQTWLLVLGFQLEKHRGSNTPTATYFGLDGQGASGPQPAKAGDGRERH